MVPLHWYLTLSAAVFMIGMFGFLTRRNIIIMFMSVELMLNAVNISLVSFSHFLQDMRGHILVFFVITVAAAEAAIGLAIFVLIFRSKGTINIDQINLLKG